MRILRCRSACACGIALLAATGVLALGVVGVSLYIDTAARPFLYSDLESLPPRSVGLLLGTSRNRSGGLNEFYAARIEAAALLFHNNKIEHIIASGSNPSRYYNEPVAMKRDLVARNVPAESITADYAGLRTLDSVVRADKVMGQKSFLVVSQCFHAARAIFLAREFGLDVIGYCAEDPPGPVQVSARLREFGARCKAVLDVTVLGTQPQYLGAPSPIDLRSTAPEPHDHAVADMLSD